MTASAKLNVMDGAGTRQDVELKLEDYREAATRGLNMAQLYARRYNTPDALAQLAASAGFYVRENSQFGLNPCNLHSIMAGTLVRNDGSDAASVTGRLLFPMVVLDMIESELREDNEGWMGQFMQMVAYTENLTSAHYVQPKINLKNPGNAEAMPVGQGALPPTIGTIELAETSRRLPTASVGLEITDEAQSATSLPLVRILIREQMLAQRVRDRYRDIKAMVDGDTDSDQTALSSVTAKSFDDSIVAAGTLTQRAWLFYLYAKWKVRRLTWAMMDLDTYLKLEARTGRPTQDKDDSKDGRLDVKPVVLDPRLPDRVNVFLMDETDVLGANTIVGIDPTKAMRRVVNVSAKYEAIEQFVLKRVTGMRFDASERIERIFDEGWSKMTLTV